MPFSSHKLAFMLGLDQPTWKDAGSDELLKGGAKIESAHMAMSRIISYLNSFSGGYKSTQIAAKKAISRDEFKRLTILINE